MVSGRARVIDLRGLNAAELRAHPGLDEAAEILRTGGVVAFPTETVYGLGGNAWSREALAAIFGAKDRPGDNPSIVHIAAIAELERIAVVEDRRLFDFLDHFWPGPLTAIFPCRDPPIAAAAFSGQTTVAVRIPDHPVALELIGRAGFPIAAPSANRSGRPSPTSAEHVMAELGDRIPLVLDGGRCRVGLESTVVDFSDGEPAVLRPGRIGAAELAARLGRPIHAPAAAGASRSPGTRYDHYKPSVPVVSFFLEREADLELLPCWLEGLCLSAALLPAQVAYVGPEAVGLELAETRWRSSDAALAHHLYTDLWELELRGVALIVVGACAPSAAVRDRLGRASSYVVDGSPRLASPDSWRELQAALDLGRA